MTRTQMSAVGLVFSVAGLLLAATGSSDTLTIGTLIIGAIWAAVGQLKT